MKKYIIALCFFGVVGIGSDTHAFSFSFNPQQMVEDKIKASVKKLGISEKFNVFKSMKDKVAGAFSNPGKLIADYTVTSVEEQKTKLLGKLNKHSALALQEGKNKLTKQLQASSFTVQDQILKEEVTKDFLEERYRILDKVVHQTNNSALQAQQQLLDAESQREDQTEITKQINEEMDKILELTDKICSYQSPQIPCFPSQPKEPVEADE